MANVLKHSFVSPIVDEGAVDIVGPDEWNAQHPFSGGSTLNYLMWDATQSDKVSWDNVWARFGVLDITKPPYNCVGDDSVDYTTTIQTALNDAISQKKRLYIPNKVFKITGNLTGTSSANPIIIFGDGTLDGTSAGVNGNITLQGSLGSSASLGADASEGNVSITCALSVVKGDILKIESTVTFSSASASFVKGELVEVLSSGSGVITLSAGLYDSYTSATTTVQKINTPTIGVEGITILRDGNGAGLTFNYGRNVFARDIRLTGARERGIYLNLCYGGEVDNCHVNDSYFSGSGTSYAFVIASCYNISIHSNRFLSGRHGISNGGTIPFRNLTFTNNVVDNTHGIPNYCFDCHANGQNIIIANNQILNGMDVECIDFTISNNIVRSVDYQYAILTNQYSNARSAQYINIINNQVINLLASGNGIVFTTSGTGTINIGTLNISNNTHVESDSSSLRVLTNTPTLNIDLLSIQNNTFRNASFFSAVIATGGSGVITATKQQITNNYFYAARGVQVLVAGHLIFNSNQVFGTTAGLFLLETQFQTAVICNSNMFDGDSDSAGIKFNTGDIVVFNDNIVINVNSARLTTTASVAKLHMGDTIFNNSSGAFSINAATELHSQWFVDGVTAPASVTGEGYMYIDTADGDLKIKFGDGTTKTIATNP